MPPKRGLSLLLKSRAGPNAINVIRSNCGSDLLLNLAPRALAAIQPPQRQPGFLVAGVGLQSHHHLSPQILPIILCVLNEFSHPQHFDRFIAKCIVIFFRLVVPVPMKP